jgi:3-phenylpropionate/trans-cinnamate dioxygenase ferredoxin reductase component
MTAQDTSRVPFLIVGGGLAGARAAEAIRQEGATGQIVLVSREQERPYHRPPLSKDFLRAETKREDVFVHPADWAQQHDVEIRLGVGATHLDVPQRTVTLSDGAVLGFERLLLATGSRPRPLSVPGADLAGVFLLRTLEDAERIRQAAGGKRRAVIIGGGFIGAEVAASLQQMGLETSLVGRGAMLWEHLFGNRLAPVFQRTLTDRGVEIINADQATSLEGRGRVERVRTKGGRTLECDLVVAGIGATPEMGLVEGTPILIDNGVVTDEFLRTNQSGISAAGDIARFFSPLYAKHLRVEHWDVAQQHGEIAGKNMAREATGKGGERVAFDQPPYFFSDLFDLSMEYLGHSEGADEVLARGDTAGREFTGFYLKEARLVAALFVNRNADVEPTRTLIQRRLLVDERVRGQLANLAVDLQSLAR